MIIMIILITIMILLLLLLLLIIMIIVLMMIIFVIILICVLTITHKQTRITATAKDLKKPLVEKAPGKAGGAVQSVYDVLEGNGVIGRLGTWG